MGTHLLVGHYRSKRSFKEGTFSKLGKVLPDGAQLRVTNVIIAGDMAWWSSSQTPVRETGCASTTIIAGLPASTGSSSVVPILKSMGRGSMRTEFASFTRATHIR